MSIGTNNLFSLGMSERDRLNTELGGGIPPESIVLVEGDYGAGKSALSQRFAYGLCEEGQSVAMLSTESTVGSYPDRTHSVGYGVVEHILDENLLFLHADVGGGNTFSGQEEESDREDLLTGTSVVISSPHASSVRPGTNSSRAFSAMASKDARSESTGRTDGPGPP